MYKTPGDVSLWIRDDIAAWSALTCGRAASRIKRNCTLFHEDEQADRAYIVKSGRLRLTSLQESGAEKHILIAEVGSMVGELAALSGSMYRVSAVAIVDTEVYAVPAAALEAALKQDWALVMRVLRMQNLKNTILLKQVVDLSFTDAMQRVAQTLINIAGEYGKDHGDGIHITIKFTHQDMANITNTSRVTVSNVFNLLAADGVIAKNEGYFVLKDICALQKIAKRGPEKFDEL